MAALMIPLPEETARVLSEIQVPGKKVDQGSSHITVLYLGKNVPVERIAVMIPVLFSITSETAPFAVSTSHVTTFPSNPDDGTPIIARIESEPLHALRKKLCAALDKAGVEYDKKYPEYKPHTTLAYDPDPDTHGSADLDIPEITWGAHEIVLWGSDQGTGRLVVKFPFSIPGKTARERTTPLYRAATQLAAWKSRYPVV